MKKIVNYLSVGLILLMVYAVVPSAQGYVEGDNHKKKCLLKPGCKFKVDRSCFGSLCKDPNLEAAE